MGISSGTDWEVRTTGNVANGGGYADLAPGTGTDYSTQDAAELSLTDGANSGVGVTTFTSATGGFTEAMIGNVLYITTGTNVLLEYFQITAYTDTNTVTLDRAPDDGVGAASGADFKVGGATDNPKNIQTAVVGNNTIYIKNGTYTNAAAAQSYVFEASIDGGGGTPIDWRGYNSTRNDNPVDNNRPHIDADSDDTAALNIATNTVGNRFFYLIFENGTGDGVSSDTASTSQNIGFFHCLAQNNGDDGFDCATGALFSCEASGNGSNGIERARGNEAAIYCYFHDNGANGSQSGHDYHTISETNSADGFTPVSGYFEGPLGCIAWNNTGAATDGITTYQSDGAGSQSRYFWVNNISQDNGQYGFNRTSTKHNHPYFDYNCYEGNGSAGTYQLTAGDNDVTSDPLFTSATNSDFTIQSGSPVIAAGLGPGDPGVGTTGDYKINMGLDQDDVAAAGNGGSGWYAGE